MLPFHRRAWLHHFLAVACAALLHSGLLAVAVVLWLMNLGLFAIEVPEAMLTVAPVRDRDRQVELTSAFEPPQQDTAHRIEADELLAGLSDPRWQALVDPVPPEAPEHSGSFVSAQLARITHEASKRSVDDNLARLTELSQQVSSTQAVDDINARLGQVLQIEQRADRPAEGPVAGEFDFATAQLHDVHKRTDEEGRVTYWAVLVDSAGRQFESPMADSEGETAFRTMNLIKTNPLLERVYRGVVMSMMDKVLKNVK